MDTPPVALHETEDHVLRSEHLGREMHLWIGRPVAGVAPSGGPPSLLWVLDGDLFFGTVVETTRLMHQLYGELRPILVVGVAYGTGDPHVQGELRGRDLTPTSVAAYEEMGARASPGRRFVLPAGERTGGASFFLRFLLEEARPYIEERFEVASGKGTLFGSSLGGLFAVWALLTEPSAFEHVIALSPALWWDHGTVLELEEEVARSRDDLAAGLFLAAGALEEPEDLPFLSQFRLVSNVRLLAERLAARGYPSLDVRSAVLDGETHTSVVGAGLTRGLRAFLRGAPP